MQKETPNFFGFPKMARWSRDSIITEKLDGTNAQILITEDGDIFPGSRTRWITPEEDNHGFARWVMGNKDSLLTLGPGRHFGEWWGSGINRGYGLQKGEKRFSLFNTQRWALYGTEPKFIPNNDPRIEKYQDVLPEICSLVPVLYQGLITDTVIDTVLEDLKNKGSIAAPGYMNPEGIIIYHIAGNVGFKKTLLHDDIPKILI